MTMESNTIALDRGRKHVGGRTAPVNKALPPANAGDDTIEYPEQYRFAKPVTQTFPLLGSITSVLSLTVMAVVSTAMLLELVGPTNTGTAAFRDAVLAPLFALVGAPRWSTPQPAWTWLPFAFTIFGSGLGGLFELGLILAGTPFQQTKSDLTAAIQRVRFLNLAPVTATIFIFVAAMTIEDASLRYALLFVVATIGAGLGFALAFGPPNPVVPLFLLGAQVAQAVLVLVAGIPVGGAFLLAQAALQLTALLVGTATPKASTIFHLTSTLSGVALFAALMTATAADPGFAAQVATPVPAGGVIMWGLVVACLAGVVITMRVFPLAYATLRVIVTNAIWTPIYFKLVSQGRFPNPVPLDAIYTTKAPAPARLVPYSVAHSADLPEALSIPALYDGEIERNVLVFEALFKQAKSAFKLIATLDHLAPQSDVGTRLDDKLRLAVTDDGSAYWPAMFEKTIFGAALPDGGVLEPAPKPALDAFAKGQLLAYLTEFGVASSFAKPAPERGPGALVSDFRFLERYETKPDYESYGGMAYFRVDAAEERLVLESLVLPFGTEEIAADPRDPTFRRAEAIVLASMYFQVISGKHLAEIHMTYNLVEASMHNAFDAQGQWNHPLRAFLYLHFFSHELAEEMTTEHLVQEGAVFAQIFATTDDALIAHLNNCYAACVYGEDEDFEARKAAMSIPSADGSPGKLLPNCSVAWELAFFDIFLRYTTDLVDIIYATDDDVRADRYVADFHRGLTEVFLRGLPARYDAFQTKGGLARFAADTIHHCTVRHQVYGTTGIKAALDPRISKTQVPKDGGTTGVEEWRSLAYVALATGKARFTLLTGEKGQDFTNLLRGIPEPKRARMAEVFGRLQADLRELDVAWTSGPDAKTFNYDYLRALPSELHTGPGY